MINDTLVGDVYFKAMFSKTKYNVIPHIPHKILVFNPPYDLWPLVNKTRHIQAMKNLIVAVMIGGRVSMITEVAINERPQNRIVDHK